MSQPPSFAADSSSEPPRYAALLATLERLTREHVLGFVWADEDLRVATGLGEIVQSIQPGRPLPEVLVPLHGYEETLHALKATGGSLQLPNLKLVLPVAVPGRFNLSVYWMPDRRQYLVLVTRVLSELEFEHQLHQQVRLRQLAEEKIVAQAQELETANRELLRANRDLDQFAYVLSHDLKAPLRALRLLARDVEAALSSGDAGALAVAASGIGRQSLRISRMMTGLYEYTRLGRGTPDVDEIDTRLLIEAIAGSLPPRPGFRIEIAGTWPLMSASEAPLDLVLRNLIENAIKHHDRETGTISITAEDRATELVLVVADDGPGIPKEHMATVFEPFVQLDTGSPTEGYGMGLALVKKAVDRAGGSISFSPRPNGARGVEFRVVWPKGR